MKNLQPGNYELKLTKPGFTDYVQRIPIASGVTVEVIADMTLKPSQNGILSVYSYPAGGSVSLDGNLVGTSPVWLSDVKPGIHQLKVTSPGYLDWSQTIDVRGGGSVTYVTAALYPGWWSPMYGYVMISSLPAGGNAFIDGVPQGMTPITISQVKPGDHTVRVEYSGYPAWEQRISVMEGRTSYVIAQMGQSSVPITQMSVQTRFGQCITCSITEQFPYIPVFWIFSMITPVHCWSSLNHERSMSDKVEKATTV